MTYAVHVFGFQANRGVNIPFTTTQSTYTSVDDHTLRAYRESLAAIVEAQFDQHKSLDGGKQGVQQLWRQAAGRKLVEWVLVRSTTEILRDDVSTAFHRSWIWMREQKRSMQTQ